MMTTSSSPNLRLAVPQGSPMSFSGRGREFLGMLITGSLFQIPTFGFYRFWLITKLRRHLWANTQIEGEAFEYTGTAKELLIGFLMALAVLAPLYITYFILAFILEERAAFASLPLILIMYVLMHFGVYRARKYRATRTVFRGVRFWMTGSGWAYALRAILWDVATILTLGLALPWATASLERYRMRHTYFGSVQGGFAGTGWTLFKRGWWVWALSLIVVVGSFALGFSMADAYPEQKEFYAGMTPFLGIFLAMLLWPLALAIFTRWHIDGLRFGDVIVSSSLKAGSVYSLFVKVFFSSIGFSIAFAVVVGIFAAVGALLFQDSKESLQALQTGEVSMASIGIGAAVAIGYLIFLLGFGVIQRYFFGRGLWAAIVTTTAVSNLTSVDAVAAAGQPAGVLGEGLADALDFNVGI
jgi:uncharacterized membrane protein YjgN (DUF898 family)